MTLLIILFAQISSGGLGVENPQGQPQDKGLAL